MDQPPRDGYIPLDCGSIYYRDIGQGRPIIVLHGGPSFDHTYLLPEMDLLAETFRLIYYDQRGRGKSTSDVRPEDVSIASEVADLNALGEHLQLDSVALLGHSWGGLLALEYAIRHPERVSALILMNSAPASYQDWIHFDEELNARRVHGEQDRMQDLAASASFGEGDPDARADYYRIHFRPGLARPDELGQLVARLRARFAGMTRTDMLLAGNISERLFDETAESSRYDLLPQLTRLRVPTLVIHGDHDFIPIECVAHVAEAIIGAQLVVLEDCGHFAYLERLEAVRKEIVAFLGGSASPGTRNGLRRVMREPSA